MTKRGRSLSMLALGLWLLGPSIVGDAPVLAAGAEELSAQQISNAITELDVQRAHAALQAMKAVTPSLSYQRARLAIYVGDCDSAEAILATLPETPESGQLLDLARRCARATAGSVVLEDERSGVWVRVQDAADAALVPLIVEVAVRSRQTMIDDLGISLPLPLRIDLVRDLFSLSAVSGLPLEAAETTGTVAVARWGRVTMLTPRAAQLGYPWQDTLAHELTHLALSRGSRDYAPLWLQEGIAKREETRWRPERPFDDNRDAHAISREALLTGRSVGIDKIGPSIAMLPSADDARISYAEVQSFMDYWISSQGRGAFALLLLDLKGLSTRETDEAMLSVTGFPLRYWIARWQDHLRALPDPAAEAPESEDGSGTVVQSVRLGDLLTKQARVALASDYFARAVELAPTTPGVRFRSAAAQLSLGNPERAENELGSLSELGGVHGGWLGLHGRILREKQQLDRALEAFSLATAVDPYSSEASCEGHGERTRTGPGQVLEVPSDPVRRRLCDVARTIVRD